MGRFIDTYARLKDGAENVPRIQAEARSPPGSNLVEVTSLVAISYLDFHLLCFLPYDVVSITQHHWALISFSGKKK